MTRRFLLASSVALAALCASAEPGDPSPYLAGMRWRMIGPFRGGRTVGAAGVPGKPNVFYIGVNNGGVWKTDDSGRTWTPIFDDQPTGSIGALAVAPSDPNIIYVGSGEGLQRPDLSVGDGIYKSTDGGKTWRHLGLRDGQQIGAILVDPRDPNRLFVAVLGHPYGPNASAASSARPTAARPGRRCSIKDENTGAIDLAFDPRESADRLRRALGRRGRGRGRTATRSAGPSSGLFKSTDGGTTWQPLDAAACRPSAEGLGRIGIAIAPSDPQPDVRARRGAGRRGGLYRSDDAGASWRARQHATSASGAAAAISPACASTRRTRTSSTSPTRRPTARPTAARRSRRSRARRAATTTTPSGSIPTTREIILLAADQGATITVNGGADLELLVQPADRAVLPRHHRQPVSVLGLRRAAGERLGRRRQPRQRRPDHVPRLASRRRRGVRLRRARSARSRTSSTAAR